MKISRLQYISQESNGKTHLENIEEACLAGIDWIQLRIKDKPLEEIKRIALEARIICTKYKAKLILNDYVTIAKEIKADGVHIGKTDISLLEARQILGDKVIIGGTANTFEDIKFLSTLSTDYIGLGPFQFTHTKENLSPVIGLDGYRNIVKQCHEQKIKIPIIAIGGILAEDTLSILGTEVYGIAMSNTISKAQDKKAMVTLLHYKINLINSINESKLSS